MVTFASVYLIEKCQTQQEKNGDISGLIFRLSYVPESGALVAYFIAPTQLHFFSFDKIGFKVSFKINFLIKINSLAGVGDTHF